MADQTPDAMMYVGVEAIPGDVEKLLRELSGLTKAASKNPVAFKLKIDDTASATATANVFMQKVISQSSKAYAELRKVGVETRKAEEMVENIINQGFSGIIQSVKTKGGPLAAAIDSALLQGLVEGFGRAEAKLAAAQKSLMEKSGKQSSSYGAMQNRVIQDYEKQARALAAEQTRNQQGPSAPSASQLAANARALAAEQAKSKKWVIPDEPAEARQLRKAMEAKFRLLKSQGMSVPDAASQAMRFGETRAEGRVGVAGARGMAEQAGAKILFEKQKAEKKELDKAASLAAENRAKTESLQKQEDAASRARAQTLHVDPELEYMERRRKEMEKKANAINKTQERIERGHQRAIQAENQVYGPAAPTAAQLAANQRAIQAENRRRETARDSQFSRSAISNLARNIKREYGLYGESLFQAADHAIDDMLARAGTEFGVGSARYRQIESRLQRAFGKDVESRRLIGRASVDAMTQKVLESMGSVAGTSVGAGQIRQSLQAALQDRTARRDLLGGRVASGTASQQEREDAFKARQDVSELGRRLQAVDRIEREKARIQERIENNQGSRFFGGMRGNMLNRQMEQKNAEMQKLYGGGPMGGKTSAHGAQFAAMNAAYGFQDFFQVLAQPGMGPGRAFLAAANNIGPALSGMAGSGVKANLAIGGLMAGMAGLNMLMEKEKQESDRLSKSILDQANAIDRLAAARQGLSESRFGGLGASGLEGTLSAFQKMMNRPKSVEGLGRELEATQMAGRPGAGARSKALSNLEGMAETAFNTIKIWSLVPTGGLSYFIPNYQGTKDAFRGNSSVKERSDLFFKKPKTFSEAVLEDPSLKGHESEYRKLFEQQTNTYNMRKESGFFDRFQKRIDEINEERLLLRDIEKEIPSGGKRTMDSLGRAKSAESRLGIRGLQESFVEQKYNERLSALSASEQARFDSDSMKKEIERLETDKVVKKAAVESATGVGRIEAQSDLDDVNSQLGILKNDLINMDEKVRVFSLVADASAKEFREMSGPGIERMKRRVQFPDAMAAANGNVGGYLEKGRYGSNSGAYLNFQEKIMQMQRDLAEKLRGGVDDKAKSDLRAAHEKAVAREIESFAGGSGTGKASLMDSGSLWSRIQESLTSDPLVDLNRKQLDELRSINAALHQGKNPASPMYQGMLQPIEGNDSGGYAGGGKKPSARDTILAKLREGEVVLTPEHQARIAQRLKTSPADLFGGMGMTHKGSSLSAWANVGGFDGGGMVGGGLLEGIQNRRMTAENYRKWLNGEGGPHEFTRGIKKYEQTAPMIWPQSIGAGGPSSPAYPSSGLGNRHPGGIPIRDSRGTFIGGRYYMGSGGDMPTNSQQMNGLLGAYGSQAYNEGRSYSPHKQAWRQFRKLHGQMTGFNRGGRKWDEEEPFRERYAEYGRQSARFGMSGFYRNQGVPLYGRGAGGRGGRTLSGPGAPTNAEAWPSGMPFMGQRGVGLPGFNFSGSATTLPEERLRESAAQSPFLSGRGRSSMEEAAKQRESREFYARQRGYGDSAGNSKANAEQLAEMRRRGMSSRSVEVMAGVQSGSGERAAEARRQQAAGVQRQAEQAARKGEFQEKAKADEQERLARKSAAQKEAAEKTEKAKADYKKRLEEAKAAVKSGKGFDGGEGEDPEAKAARLEAGRERLRKKADEKWAPKEEYVPFSSHKAGESREKNRKETLGEKLVRENEERFSKFEKENPSSGGGAGSSAGMTPGEKALKDQKDRLNQWRGGLGSRMEGSFPVSPGELGDTPPESSRTVRGGDRLGRWRAGAEDDRKMREEGNRLQMDAYKKHYDELPQKLMQNVSGQEQAASGVGFSGNDRNTAVLERIAETLITSSRDSVKASDKVVSAIEGSGISIS